MSEGQLRSPRQRRSAELLRPGPHGGRPLQGLGRLLKNQGPASWGILAKSDDMRVSKDKGPSEYRPGHTEHPHCSKNQPQTFRKKHILIHKLVFTRNLT